jgi:uncharacterized protein YegP (UPF0339 family)
VASPKNVGHTGNFPNKHEGGTDMAAKFEIRSPKAGQFRWVLVSQGRTLATSPAYSRRALAQKSIDSFRMAAIAAPVADLTVPAAKTPAGKTARATGRAVGKAAGTTRKTVRTAAEKTAKAAKKTAAPRKRAARSR